jgi:RNA polymerase sigma factor (sigma-70 family)
MLSSLTSVHPHTWVKMHADYLYAFAVKRVSDEDLARDLVQDTFLAALQKVESFEGQSSERTWLTAILKNKIIDVYRKKSQVIVSSGITNAEKDQQDFFHEDGHWNQAFRPVELGIEENYFENKELNRC